MLYESQLNNNSNIYGELPVHQILITCVIPLNLHNDIVGLDGEKATRPLLIGRQVETELVGGIRP